MRCAMLPLVTLTLCLAWAGSAQALGPNNALNDTGIKKFGDETQNTLTTEPATHPGQDASQGRDAAASAGTLVKVGGGVAGFDFTKIANNGNVLPADAPFGTGLLDWGCTYDNVTGLMWEIKLNNPAHLRHLYFAYTWYDTNPATNGGAVGTDNSGLFHGVCLTTGRCDTEKFALDVNVGGMCGHNDWRLPTLQELVSLIDYSRAVNPMIDVDYFPNTMAFAFWTSSTYANNINAAWFVSYYYGRTETTLKTASGQVRLVRAGK